MTYLGLRRDERGRPIGLDWPPPPPDESKTTKTMTAVPRDFTGVQNLDGRPREDYCGKGLHLMSEHGREIKSGSKGRYCAACKADYKRQQREKSA